MLENRSSADSHVTAYRPDLDGLRAIAVISVIAFHLARTVLPGGYLGVDIFFVLSGYLITSIIWREIALGRFSIGNFYNRRIRRIMPALLLVLFATGIGAAFVLLPIDFTGFGHSTFAALAFVANVYFWRDTNYFSRVAEEKPLLHIWSLGVEEQFYLLFPLLLALLARRLPRHVLPVMVALSVVSLAGNFIALRFGGVLPAFYLLPTRAWELGAGALLALAPAGPERRPAVATVLGLIGAFLIAVALATGRAPMAFGIPDALPAVAGAALIVWAGRSGGGAIGRVLSWPAPVFAGLISYSLYLWHWPVIVLLKYYLVRELTGAETAAAVAVMVTCATLSWRYVERPFRSLNMPIAAVYSAVLAATSAMAAIAGVIVWQQGFPGRLNAAAARMNASVGTHYRCAVSDYLLFSQSRACELGLPSRNPEDADVVLFGNSHAQMYAPLIRDIVAGQSRRGLLVPMNGCTPTAGANISANCRRVAQRNIEAIVRLPRARVVILATTWMDSSRRRELIAALDQTIDSLARAGKQVVLIGPLAAPGWDVASIASRKLAFGQPLDRPLFRPRAEFETDHADVFAQFENRGDVIFVRPDQVQCAGERCEFVMDGRSLFADGNHVATPELARFRPLFEKALQRALAAPPAAPPGSGG